jgi:hypothetical protein
LLVPTLGIAAQDEAVLRKFHNRRLSTWPTASAFPADPARYFQSGKTWLAERVFPVKQVTEFQKSVVFYLLNGAPEPRITLGKEGHIFLNGANNREINELFETACVHAHSKQMAAELEGLMAAWAQTGRDRNLAVDVVVVPTAASLYADKLPHGTPAKYRRECLKRTNGNSPLLAVRTPADINFVYPLREMLAARDDEAFFPKGNWHPTGLSLKVARDTYLARLQTSGAVDEVLELGRGPAEILTPYGIRKNEPTYVIRNHNVAADSGRNAALRRTIVNLARNERFVTHVFTNSKPVVDQSVLMLSDSFGDLASEAFAGAFRLLLHVNTNEMIPGRTLQLVDYVRRLVHIDRLIVLIEEGNTSKLAGWHK